MTEEPGSGPRRLRTTKIDFGDGVRLSRRSVLLVVLVALVPVLSAIGVVLILSAGTGRPDTQQAGQDSDQGQGQDSDQDSDQDSGQDRGADPAPDDGGGTPAGSGVREANQDDAADALRDAGTGRIGSVAGAWTWRDGDAETLLAVTRRVTRRNGDLSARAVTLRVTTLADPGGSPKVLATLEDPGPTCPEGTELAADPDPRDAQVRDLDGDGTREAVVGWAHACGADVQRRVTVLAGTATYTLTGQGAVAAEPDPPLADWPDGYLDAASAALDAAG